MKFQNIFRSSNHIKSKIASLKSNVKDVRKVHERNIKKANDFEEEVFKALYDDTQVDDELRSLFHRLNYQRVVDDMSKNINKWKFTLAILTFIIVSSLAFLSISVDHIVPDGHDGVLSDYERMISAIDLEINWQKHGHAIYPKEINEKTHEKDSTLVELSIQSISPREGKAELKPLIDATESFWYTYYIRYMLIRVFISAIIFLFISAAIKVYMRLRRDRMSLIYKEEATTTILYFIQKYLTTLDKNGEKVTTDNDKEKIMQLLPLIANELYHNPEIKTSGSNDYEAITLRLMQMMESVIGANKNKGKA